MRLWHNSLIKVLTRNQLLGQWRELNSIFKLKNRHILINFVYEYPDFDLYCYSMNVINEMKRRGYRVDLRNFINRFEKYNFTYSREYIPFENKMNDTYLKICIANLYEKYLCHGLTEDEWQNIYNAHKDITNSMNI